MSIKNTRLIEKLLLAVMTENGDSITLQDLERYLDGTVSKHDTYPDFPNNSIRWNLEDSTKLKEAGFHELVSKMSGDGDLVTITLDPSCPGCDRELKKHKSTKDSFVFRCKLCSMDYTFELKHTGESTVCIIDDDNELEPQL